MNIAPGYDHITSPDQIGTAMIGWVRAARATGCAMLCQLVLRNLGLNGCIHSGCVPGLKNRSAHSL